METDHSQAKLDQILLAAQKRFGHYGLSKTTMTDIADDIGMSKASLYYYFKDKESIFIAVSEKELQYFVHEMKKIINSDIKASAMLFDCAELRIKLLKNLLTLGKFSSGNYQEVKPMLHLQMQHFRKIEMEIIADIIETGVKRKEFAVDNISTYAEFFIDALRGLRKATVSTFTEKGIYTLPPKEYQKLKQQSQLLTELFVKAISV